MDYGRYGTKMGPNTELLNIARGQKFKTIYLNRISRIGNHA